MLNDWEKSKLSVYIVTSTDHTNEQPTNVSFFEYKGVPQNSSETLSHTIIHFLKGDMQQECMESIGDTLNMSCKLTVRGRN